MKNLVASRWFMLADLAAVSTSIILWEFNPGLRWQPLLIALLPWIVRISGGTIPFKRTKFDLLIVVFMITAAVGVWAAYDRETAWSKFWLLSAGILLYYALVNQPQENLWLVAGLISIFAAGTAVYFVLTYDWQNQSADFQILTRIGDWWMAHRPVLNADATSANFTGGILAMLLPYPLVLSIHALRKRQLLLLVFAGLAASLAFGGLLMTSSRAAWSALSIALGCWLLWEVTGWMIRRHDQFLWRNSVNQRSLFVVILLVIGGFTSFMISNSSGGLAALFNTLPGANDGGSRLELYRNSIYLFKDFIFTGGGLGTFAGLYSRYILVIPHFFLGYSHNLFLDLGIEQGIFGVGAFLLIFILTIYLLFSDKRISSFQWAILASLLAIGLHGLLDDALYGERGTPFLFLSIGLALAAVQPQNSGQKLFLSLKRIYWLWLGLVAVGIAFVIVLIVVKKPLLAHWYANLGAVQMARVELVGFPTGRWDDERITVELAPARRLFTRALQLYPNNITAHYRLGLISLKKLDFLNAIFHLEFVIVRDSNHRGATKSLAYALTWNGDQIQAFDLLKKIPEAENEMEVYSWWWQEQNRPYLAELALSMSANLARYSLIPNK